MFLNLYDICFLLCNLCFLLFGTDADGVWSFRNIVIFLAHNVAFYLNIDNTFENYMHLIDNEYPPAKQPKMKSNARKLKKDLQEWESWTTYVAWYKQCKNHPKFDTITIK